MWHALQSVGAESEALQQLTIATSNYGGEAEREELQTLIAAAEELHRDLGRVLHTHGQLQKPAAATDRRKPVSPGPPNGEATAYMEHCMGQNGNIGISAKYVSHLHTLVSKGRLSLGLSFPNL